MYYNHSIPGYSLKSEEQLSGNKQAKSKSTLGTLPPSLSVSLKED